MLATVNLGQLK